MGPMKLGSTQIGVVLLFIIGSLSLFVGPVQATHVLHDFIDPNRSSFTVGQYRTGYHFQPPMNWINDPNGPMYYKGIYHLFYQYNPKGAVWGNIVWAHSVSTDMLNWISLEPAIYPSKPFDIGGCWSGSATILPGNKPAILYTGLDANKRQLQNMATPKDLSDPFLKEWIKPDYNPVINGGPGINGSAFRDPTTAWLGSDGHWRVVIGSRSWGRNRGIAVLYKSKDFVNWVEVNHPLHSMAGSGMWECPDFFPVATEGTNGLDTSENGEGVKHVFKVSLDLTRFDYYTIGKYDAVKDRYVPDHGSVDNKTGLRYDYGNFYASKTFFDPEEKRRILWGWSNESDTAHDDTAKGWAGVQVIPRSIWLDSNGRQLVQWPIKELNTLRGENAQLSDTFLTTNSVVEVQGIQTSEADVEVMFELPNLEKAVIWHSSSHWSRHGVGPTRCQVELGVADLPSAHAGELHRLGYQGGGDPRRPGRLGGSVPCGWRDGGHGVRVRSVSFVEVQVKSEPLAICWRPIALCALERVVCAAGVCGSSS